MLFDRNISKNHKCEKKLDRNRNMRKDIIDIVFAREYNIINKLDL